jgi:hypothetical protein
MVIVNIIYILQEEVGYADNIRLTREIKLLRVIYMILIEDKRQVFKTVTFSNYKKREASKKLTLALYYGKVEEAFFFTCEMLCSNMIVELWNVFFSLMSKYIHVYNPKLPIYIMKKFHDFKALALKQSNDFELRNTHQVRVLFCTVALVLCKSQKYTILDDLKYKFDFKIENLYENLKAPEVKYIEFIYKPHDPKEYIIPFNELIYHLNETKQKTDIHFWVNWIIQYDILCRKKKRDILCAPRSMYLNKNQKLSQNIIWIIWDIVLKMSKQHQTIEHIIQNLFELFTIRYSFACNKSRIHMMYHSIELLLLVKKLDLSIEVLKDKSSLQNLEPNINVIFEQIKKNETAPPPEEVKMTSEEKKLDLYRNVYNKL